jgi:predicted O-linked N-acetylglucosamine transferase (SPINDLY family)
MPTRTERIDALLREAAGALQAGDDAHAAHCAREAAALDRRHPAVANLEATLALRRGDPAAAKAVLERALRWRPSDVWLLTDLAEAERQLGHAEAALRLYRRCVALAPEAAAAQFNLGVALLAAGQPAEAVAPLQRALEIEPGLAAARARLAQALLATGRDAEAEPLLRARLRHDAADAGAALELAGLLARSGRAAEAIGLIEALDAVARQRADLSFALGNAYAARDGERSAAALEAWTRTLALDPAHAGARVNLGQSLLALRRWAEARAAVAPLLGGAAAPPDALDVEARACEQLGLVAEARATYLAIAQRLDAASGDAALFRCSDDPLRPVDATVFPYSAAFLLQYLEHDPAQAREERRRWAERAFPVAARSPAAYAGRLAAPAPRRIGYVSGDFRQHSVSYFIGPVLAAHRAGPYEVHCYSNNERDDARSAVLRERAHHWHEVRGLDDEALAARLEADAIDVLVDLSGPTLGHRLGVFARRAAPVQVTWLGYPGTTGVAAIDWRLTDARADPGGAETGYVERLWRLPGCFCCYEPPDDAPEVAPPPAAAGGAITFGSFNAVFKLGEATLGLWARVLEAVPRSRLLLKLEGGEHAANREALYARFERHGIAPRRVDIAGWTDTQAPHLARYAEVDIALDTTPYNGVTTTLEALWMGVPVVTLEGTRHAGRTGATLLAAAGLDPALPLVAADAAGYVRLASRLAADPGARAALRATLRSRLAASPLLAAARCTREVEHALAAMWQQARTGMATRHHGA